MVPRHGFAAGHRLGADRCEAIEADLKAARFDTVPDDMADFIPLPE